MIWVPVGQSGSLCRGLGVADWDEPWLHSRWLCVLRQVTLPLWASLASSVQGRNSSFLTGLWVG